MKFRTIFSFALTIAVALAQYSDVEDNASNAAAYSGDIASDVENNQAPDYADSANVNSQNAESELYNNGEVSDEYGNMDGVNAMDAGEASDNSNGNEESTNSLSPEISSSQSETQPEVEFTGASGEAAPIAASLESQNSTPANSTPEATQGATPEATQKPTIALDDASKANTPIDPAKIASGLVGAAAVSGAGVFFFMKRSKRRGLESVRSQISMA